MPMCPSCQKVKLVRCKILRTGDADYGREYVACPDCSSRWFLDDPNRPDGLVSNKPRQSIWKILGTWGAPHNVPDSSGVLHPATYVLPPVHEYPSLLVPISNPKHPSRLIPPAGPPPTSSVDPLPDSPASGPSALDLPPPPPPDEPEPEPLPPADQVDIPERNLDDPGQVADQLEPPVEDTQPSQKDEEPVPAEEPAKASQGSGEKPDQATQENAQSSQTDSAQQTQQQPEERKPAPASNYDDEEQAKSEVLSLMTSPPRSSSRASCYHSKKSGDVLSYPPSIRGSEQHQPLSPPKSPAEPISPEEQHLRETLLRVASTPRPPTPLVYPTLLSPKATQDEINCSSSLVDEHKVADYNRRISARLDEAILNSPFIPKEYPKTPGPEGWVKSPKFSEPKSPASTHSTIHSSRTGHPRSPRKRVHGTPRSPKPPKLLDSTSHTPRSPHHTEDKVPLAGRFPSPSPSLWTREADFRTRDQGRSPYSTSLKSPAPSAPLPIAPSCHTGSVAGGRTPKHVSIAGSDKSPLFG